MASQFVRRNGFDWGNPVEVSWQDDWYLDRFGTNYTRGPGPPLNRWIVLYPTPDKERNIGFRAVFVETNGDIRFVPGG